MVLALQACLMTAFYLEPSDKLIHITDTMQEAFERFEAKSSPPQSVDKGVYGEILCVIDMLRPLQFHPSHRWKDLRFSK